MVVPTRNTSKDMRLERILSRPTEDKSRVLFLEVERVDLVIGTLRVQQIKDLHMHNLELLEFTNI